MERPAAAGGHLFSRLRLSAVSSHAGSFLVARPVIQDPNFRHTVVLLLQHDADGAFGLVVNRPAKVEGLPFPVFAGGPCQAPGLLMVHGHADWRAPGDDKPEIAPGIYLGDADCLHRISDPGPDEPRRFRVFVGYAGWGPGQLEAELAVGSWAVAPANGAVLFDTPAEDLWKHLLPPLLPEPSLN
jgi:putative transcriptional regulator